MIADTTDTKAAAVGRAWKPRPSILMLDDDSFMLNMLSLMLQGMGYSGVVAANNAPQALHRLQAGPAVPDLVICDLNLPGMDGIEFLQRLSDCGFRGSVVLLSGEGLRIMHTVQKLLGGSALVILGALEKPAGRGALQAVLDCWQPLAPPSQAPGRPAIQTGDIEKALATSPWVLHYQPKVAVRTGAVCGVEALLRWEHPQMGLIGPDAFLAQAEDAGMIDSLTEWVLQAAMQQQAAWHAAGLHLQMAVNLSMDNLRIPGFAAKVGEQAKRCGVAPQDVVLEITESRLMSPLSAPLESLVRLRLQRFQLSIDDFGTGHSSLAQLCDVPFTELKIDRRFVRGARHDQITRPILESSLGLARRMSMRTVAEGVESEDDWQLLRQLECDLAQGWFVGRALPADHLPHWIQHWRSRVARLIQ